MASGFVSGPRLGRPPEEILAGEAVCAREPDLALAACCMICASCPLTGPLGRARIAVLRERNAVTLADRVQPEGVPRQRISLPPAIDG